MKNTHWTTAVVLLLLALPGQASAQSAADRASLESYRWGAVADRNALEPAREWLDDAISHRVSFVEDRAVEKARDKIAEEKSRIERGDRNRTDDLADAEDELSRAERHLSVIEARIVAAQSHLSVREAAAVTAEAVVVAAEAASASGDKAALLAAITAHLAVSKAGVIAAIEHLKIFENDELEGPIVLDMRTHNYSPSADQASIAWGSAALAALAADRAEAIVDALNDGEELPSVPIAGAATY